jgi:hypothetical protein
MFFFVLFPTFLSIAEGAYVMLCPRKFLGIVTITIARIWVIKCERFGLLVNHSAKVVKISGKIDFSAPKSPVDEKELAS